ncbi:hypothetical protein BC835DRAFT_157933 [Cytidiella melzeri]|nr:hypothetical protein BC835DRAFT_157933 [Cytidiella melzeri]
MENETGRHRTQSTRPLLQYVDETPPPTPLPNIYRFQPREAKITCKLHPLLVFFGSCLVFVGLFTTWLAQNIDFHTVDLPNPSPRAIVVNEPTELYDDGRRNHSEEHVVPKPTVEPTPYSPLVLGAPTESFRDNLRPDMQYITSWLDAGWNNDVMTYMNLIYLGHITDRVPVLAAFTPSFHIGQESPIIGFSEVFDVPRFISDSGIPVLEWSEVKDPGSELIDEIGCWNVWESVQYEDHRPRRSDVPNWLGLDISYTKTPEWIKMMPNYEHDKGASFWALARLAYPEDRSSHLRDDVLPSPLLHAVLPPDEHLLCYDYLYYVGAHQMMEYEYTYAPAWRYVGKHLRWTERLENIAASYVREALSLGAHSNIPPYISIHVRHGDFGNWCWDAELPEDCFAPLSVIARRVREVRTELFLQKGIDVPMSRVIMTSDETDETWWDAVAALGWARVDHEKMHTENKFGKWYPIILDAIIQSNSIGFVGTDRSTFSMLSKRRVVEWHGGVAQMVKWGKKGADDH